MCVHARPALVRTLESAETQALLLRERTSDGAAAPAVGNGSEVDEVKNCSEAKDVKEEASPLAGRPLRAAAANPAAPRGRRCAGKMDIDRRE